ncbi:MAG: hypothetical protein KAI83_06310 [Thiomargarita sp.]|nr:hypothetical protein [Thiomargarita sp.]
MWVLILIYDLTFEIDVKIIVTTQGNHKGLPLYKGNHKGLPLHKNIVVGCTPLWLP